MMAAEYLKHGLMTKREAADFVNGKQVKPKDEFVSFLSSLSLFDPQGSAGAGEACKVKSIVLENTNNAFSVSY